MTFVRFLRDMAQLLKTGTSNVMTVCEKCGQEVTDKELKEGKDGYMVHSCGGQIFQDYYVEPQKKSGAQTKL